MRYSLAMEEWKQIPSHPSYAASSLGRVKRIAPDKLGRGNGNILTVGKDRVGYSRTTVTTNGKEKTVRVSRLVCEAFHGNPNAGWEAAHCNGVMDDDRSDNLRWTTREENEADKRQHGTVYGGDAHWTRQNGARQRWNLRTSKVTEEQVRAIYRDPRAAKLIASDYGISVQAISSIKTGKSWKHVTSIITSD